MTRTTNVDQVLLLIRQQLQRLSDSGKTARKARTTAAGAAQRPSALGRLSALGQLEGLPESDLEQALIRALLTDEFGEDLANDPRFLRVAGEVSRIIATDEQAHALLRQAAGRVSGETPTS